MPTLCGFAAAPCGKAMPFRLKYNINLARLRLANLSEAQPPKIFQSSCRKGIAFPHGAAAQPRKPATQDQQ
jgi:hypothetical protein